MNLLNPLNPLNIALIGAGNLAAHLGPALQAAGHHVVQVYSRTAGSATALAARLGCGWTTEVAGITARAELYVFSVRDAVLGELAERVFSSLENLGGGVGERREGPGALFVHTAGSMPVDVLPAPRRGVLYPMQTFSKQRPLRFSEIPVFVESPTDEAMLLELASQLSERPSVLDGERRRRLHLAAVFACNFANHVYDLSSRILEEVGLPFEVMLPLIDETARKVHDLPPRLAQTGPAVRYDQNVMRRHLELLGEGVEREIYELLSRSIHDRLRPDQD